MSRGRTTSGDATGGEDRPKSGEFGALSKGNAGASLAARASSPPSDNVSADIDSDWDTPEATETKPANTKVAPKRVISIGPPADETPSGSQSTGTLASAGAGEARTGNAKSTSKRGQIESINPKSKASSAASTSKASSAPLLGGGSTSPKSSSVPPASPSGSPLAGNTVSSSQLQKLLTHGPEADFTALDIGTLVSNVMGSQPPPAPPVRASEPPARAVSQPESVNTLDDNWESPGNVSKSAPAAPTESKAPEAASTSVAPSPSKSPASKDGPPSSKRKRKGKKQPIATAKGSAAEKTKPSVEHLDAEWGAEFFSASSTAAEHTDNHDSDETFLDERRMRSLAPEVRARRARYRLWVLLIFVGMLALLGAAVALNVLRHH